MYSYSIYTSNSVFDMWGRQIFRSNNKLMTDDYEEVGKFFKIAVLFLNSLPSIWNTGTFDYKIDGFSLFTLNRHFDKPQIDDVSMLLTYELKKITKEKIEAIKDSILHDDCIHEVLKYTPESISVEDKMYGFKTIRNLVKDFHHYITFTKMEFKAFSLIKKCYYSQCHFDDFKGFLIDNGVNMFSLYFQQYAFALTVVKFVYDWQYNAVSSYKENAISLGISILNAIPEKVVVSTPKKDILVHFLPIFIPFLAFYDNVSDLFSYDNVLPKTTVENLSEADATSLMEDHHLNPILGEVYGICNLTEDN